MLVGAARTPIARDSGRERVSGHRGAGVEGILGNLPAWQVNRMVRHVLPAWLQAIRVRQLAYGLSTYLPGIPRVLPTGT